MRKLHNGFLHNLNSSRNIYWASNYKVRWMCTVAFNSSGCKYHIRILLQALKYLHSWVRITLHVILEEWANETRSGIVWLEQDAMPQSARTVIHVFDCPHNQDILTVHTVPWNLLAQVFVLW